MTIDGLFDLNDHSMINTGAILISIFKSETKCALNNDSLKVSHYGFKIED